MASWPWPGSGCPINRPALFCVGLGRALFSLAPLGRRHLNWTSPRAIRGDLLRFPLGVATKHRETCGSEFFGLLHSSRLSPEPSGEFLELVQQSLATPSTKPPPFQTPVLRALGSAKQIVQSCMTLEDFLP